MRSLPTKTSVNGETFTIADFLEAGKESLSLELVAGGENMWRKVEEPIVNRPGLALTGFYEHFACERLQLVGKAETAYLRSLDDKTRLQRLSELIKRNAFLFVFTNGQKPLKDEVELCENLGAVVLATPMKTRHFTHHSAFVLERLSTEDHHLRNDG